MVKELNAPRATSETPDAPDREPPDLDPAHSDLDIGSAVATGLRWKMLTQVVGEGTHILVALLLTRTLTPTDYGIAGMALVAASFVEILTDPALSATLIQRPVITEADKSTAFWATLALGTFLALVGISISGLVANWFGEPQVQWLFMACSLGFVVSSLASIPTALLARDLAFRGLEIREMAATVVAAATAVTIALAGFGPWAVVANSLMFGVTCTVMVWAMASWRPKTTFSLKSLRSLSGLGSQAFGSRILWWGNMNMDNVLVGRYLGAKALGTYGLAYNVMYVPMASIARPLGHVLQPAYARMSHEPERLQRAYLRSKRLTTALLSPAFLCCLVVAPDFVPVAFGPHWQGAILPLQLLCVAGVATSLTMLSGGLLLALGKGATLLRLNIYTSVITLTAFFAGLNWGIVGVAAALMISKWCLVLIDARMTTRAVSFDFRKTVAAGFAVLPLGAAAAAVGFGLRRALVAEGVPMIVRLFVVAVAFLAVYLVLLRIVLPTFIPDIKDNLLRRKTKAASVPAV